MAPSAFWALSPSLSPRTACFASVFHEVASERDGLNVVEARFRLEQALRTFGESEPQRVSEAEAPFWRHCARRAGRAESTTLAPFRKIRLRFRYRPAGGRCP